MPSTDSTWRSMFTKSSSPSRITAVRPLSSTDGAAPPWSVSQNLLSRWLRDAERDEHVLVAARARDPLGGAGGASTRPNAVRMPPAFASVSATSYAGSESRTSVAPAVTRARRRALTSAVRMTIGLSAVGAPSASRPSSASAAP